MNGNRQNCSFRFVRCRGFLKTKNVKLKTSSCARAFSLIELLVVIGIIGIVSTVVLFSTNRFNSAVLLRGLTYEIGLSLRQAQLYGVSVKEVTPGSGSFGAAYGIYLPSSTVGALNSSYPLFADINNNGLYDDGAASVIENYTIRNNFTLSNFCGIKGDGSMQCASTCPSTLPLGATSCTAGSISWLSVTFKRPDPNAIILTSAASGLPSSYAYGYISVASQNGTTRSVSVSSVGQIIINTN